MRSTLLFYDGDCGFCNRSVQFILDHERHHDIYFCALQSSKAKEYLKPFFEDILGQNTMMVLEDGILYQKSDAALKVTHHLRNPWRMLSLFEWVPKKFRDAVYDWIAANRKRILKNSYCMIPKEEMKKRFLN